jgi:hypothetical protein
MIISFQLICRSAFQEMVAYGCLHHFHPSLSSSCQDQAISGVESSALAASLSAPTSTSASRPLHLLVVEAAEAYNDELQVSLLIFVEAEMDAMS